LLPCDFALNFHLLDQVPKFDGLLQRTTIDKVGLEKVIAIEFRSNKYLL
jgi:hypothetical protein